MKRIGNKKDQHVEKKQDGKTNLDAQWWIARKQNMNECIKANLNDE